MPVVRGARDDVGLRVADPSWSGTTSTGATPWCAFAIASIAASRCPARNRSEGWPGCPESPTTTGSRGGCFTSAAGGSHTHALRAWKWESVPGIVTVPSSPFAGMPAGVRQSASGVLLPCSPPATRAPTPVSPTTSPRVGK